MTDHRYTSDTALIVVDVQNDFADPAGGLHVDSGGEVVPVLNAEIDQASEAGAPVFYTQDWHPETTPHFAKDGGVWPVHCVQGTWGAQPHPGLRVAGPIIQKGAHGEDGYSGFTMRDPVSGDEASTGLNEQLADAGVRRLVVGGLAADVCVKETVLDGRRRGYDVTVLTDGIRAVNQQAGDGERARQQMAEAGATLT